MDAGHCVEMGPVSISFTAFAFRFSGATQSIFRAEHSIGMVSVIAYGGTASRFGK